MRDSRSRCSRPSGSGETRGLVRQYRGHWGPGSRVGWRRFSNSHRWERTQSLGDGLRRTGIVPNGADRRRLRGSAEQQGVPSLGSRGDGGGMDGISSRSSAIRTGTDRGRLCVRGGLWAKGGRTEGETKGTARERQLGAHAKRACPSRQAPDPMLRDPGPMGECMGF